MSGNPNDVFRKSVLPLSVFMCVGGGIVLLISVLAPEIRNLTGFELDQLTIRVLAGSWGVLWLGVGTGLCFRRRWAWISMLVIFFGGTAINLVVGILKPETGGILSGALLLALSIGVYFVTRPAFARQQIEAESTNE